MRPSAPPDQPTSMTLGVIDIPPYPSLSTQDAKVANRYDYAMTITTTQNKRFTMRDIGSIANRVDNLEYYTSLSLLEKNAKDMLIRSGTTGQNRFQNGILVDPFAGHDIGDTLDPTYNISVDKVKTELRPAFKEYTKTVWSNSTPSTAETTYISEGYASVTIPCVSQKTYTWKGRIEFIPDRIHIEELCQSPDVVNNLNLNSHFVNIHPDPDDYGFDNRLSKKNEWREPFGNDYGHWRKIDPHSKKAPNPKDTNSDGKTDIYGNIINNYTSRDVDSINSLSDTIGKNINVSTNTQLYRDDDDIFDMGIRHKVRSHEVSFVARGLKPNTRVYVFMNNVDINMWVRQYYRDWPNWHGWLPQYALQFNTPLKTDKRGHLYGKILIPPDTFKHSALKMTIVDVTDPVLYATDITTIAVGTLFALYHDKHKDRHDYVDDHDKDDEDDIHKVPKIYSDDDDKSPNVHTVTVHKKGDDDVYPKDKNGNVPYPPRKPFVAKDSDDTEPDHDVQDGFRKSTLTNKVGQNSKHHR
jgi:hypothetical protein